MDALDTLEYMRWGKNRNPEKKGNNLPKPNFKGRFVASYNPTGYQKRNSYQSPTFSRSVFVSLSYSRYDIKNLTEATKAKTKANTVDTVEYFFRFEGTQGFNEERDDIQRSDAIESFKDDAVFRIIISPEDPEVLNKEYIRAIMRNLEMKAGLKLKWTAVFHENTDNPHAHIIISRTEGKGFSWETPLRFDRTLISEGIRKYAIDLSTKILPKKSLEEYKHPFLSSINTLGLARIDHVISGNQRKGTNLFVQSSSDYSLLSKERLQKLPKWQQELVLKRLEFLSENSKAGFKKVGSDWRCYNPTNWKNILVDEEKLSRLGVKENVIIEHSDKPLLREYEGTVLECVIVNDNEKKVGLLIEERSGLNHYVETEMEFKTASMIVGYEVRVSAREAKTERFRTPVVSIVGKVTR